MKKMLFIVLLILVVTAPAFARQMHYTTWGVMWWEDCGCFTTWRYTLETWDEVDGEHGMVRDCANLPTPICQVNLW